MNSIVPKLQGSSSVYLQACLCVLCLGSQPQGWPAPASAPNPQVTLTQRRHPREPEEQVRSNS